MKISKYVLLICVLSSLLICCVDTKKLQKEYLGRIKDVSVVPTSSNEKIKTQIKTDTKFIVVYNIPMLSFNERLYGLYDKSSLVYVVDDSGRCYQVCY